MSWLRIDDRTLLHPKIRCLPDTRFRVWMRMLCACSQHEDPTVDEGLISEVKDLGPATIRQFVELGLLDETPDGYRVHDWEQYRPRDATASVRMQRYRNARRNGSVTATVTKPLLARAMPDQTRKESTSDVDVMAEPLLETSRESLPDSQQLNSDAQKGDPVIALLVALPDADAGTETVLRSFHLPEFAYRNATEQVQEQHGGVKLAVTILKRLKGEIEPVLSTPDDDIPF